MIISFPLPHVFSSASSSQEDAEVLNRLLNLLIEVDTVWLKHHPTTSLYQSGVRYGRTTEWDCIPALYQRRYGDCKSLTAARIAELRKEGRRAAPVFRWKVRKDGGKDYHILLITDSNSEGFEDPSRILGMNNEDQWFRS